MMRAHGVYRATLGTAILALLAGCGSSDNAGPTPALVIAVASGDGQSAAVASGATLSARVTDGAGGPQSGVSVAWSVVSGGGAVRRSPTSLPTPRSSSS